MTGMTSGVRLMAHVLAAAVLMHAMVPGTTRATEPTASGPSATPGPGAGAMQVAYFSGLLVVQAQGADLAALLKKVGEATRLPVEIGAGVRGTVTVSFAGLSLEEGIGKILSAHGEKNLTVQYTRRPGAQKDVYVIERIQVLRSAGASAPAESPQERAAALEAREREYREFFAMMDKDRNKIARAIKEYQDSDTSEHERIKLRNFLRGTSIDSPEDKKLIKGVLLDSRLQGEIASDLQMALMHAMQDHPEESDKDFILELLQRNDNRVGWLYYGMLKVWDPRYVPYLMQGAREGSDIDIEILGRMRVKEALPLLEDIILKKIETNGPARNQARMAWIEITGARYPAREGTRP